MKNKILLTEYKRHQGALSGSEFGDSMFKRYIRALAKKEAYIMLNAGEDASFTSAVSEYERKQYLLLRTSGLNYKGQSCEKEGDIAAAISYYEENIDLGYPATHAYDRLMIIYKKLGKPEEEKRVTLRAIEVFEKAEKTALLEGWKKRLLK